MKSIVLSVVLAVLIVSPCTARDFIVEFVAENYRETRQPYSNTPQIYHSVQVNSHAGPKLLILTGDDPNYRKWLRRYIAEDRKFIAKVPETDNDRFISEKAFEIDVTRLHPFSSEFWETHIRSSKGGGPVANVFGLRHILVIDTNEKRVGLISDVVRSMGYTPTVSRNGDRGLDLFRVQPEKFEMIIANHKAPGVKTEKFVEQVLKIDHEIPILVETGYRNKKARARLQEKFAGAGSVVLTPMVLKNLQKTIKSMIKDNAPETGDQSGPMPSNRGGARQPGRQNA